LFLGPTGHNQSKAVSNAQQSTGQDQEMFCNAAIAGRESRLRVKSRKAQIEHNISAVPPEAAVVSDDSEVLGRSQ